MERTSQQIGKRAEYLVFSELIKGRAEIYVPLIDTGIDAIIRREDGKHLDIQVKSTEKGWSFAIWLSDKYDEEKLKTFFIVCVDMSKQPPETWILPSNKFKEYATKASQMEGLGYYRLNLDAKSKRHGNKRRREILQEYLGAWKLLAG